jgi:hypothetical protein
VSYTIEWRPAARKEVCRLDPLVRRRVITAIEALAGDPCPAVLSHPDRLPLTDTESASATTASSTTPTTAHWVVLVHREA